jgi:hypothetical protein
MNRVDVQAQHDRELKKGRKVTRMEEGAKEPEKVIFKLLTKADMKGHHQGRGGWVGWREPSKVCAPSLLIICFHVG